MAAMRGIGFLDLLAATPTYNGYPAEDPIRWILKIERIATALSCTEDIKLAAAVSRLEGGALDWNEGQLWPTWECFKVSFLNRYKESDQIVRHKLSECRMMTGESVQSYIDRYRMLVLRAQIQDPEEILDRFLAGLSNTIYDRVIVSCPTNFEEAIQKALYFSSKLLVNGRGHLMYHDGIQPSMQRSHHSYDKPNSFGYNQHQKCFQQLPRSDYHPWENNENIDEVQRANHSLLLEEPYETLASGTHDFSQMRLGMSDPDFPRSYEPYFVNDPQEIMHSMNVLVQERARTNIHPQRTTAPTNNWDPHESIVSGDRSKVSEVPTDKWDQWFESYDEPYYTKGKPQHEDASFNIDSATRSSSMFETGMRTSKHQVWKPAYYSPTISGKENHTLKQRTVVCGGGHKAVNIGHRPYNSLPKLARLRENGIMGTSEQCSLDARLNKGCPFHKSDIKHATPHNPQMIKKRDGRTQRHRIRELGKEVHNHHPKPQQPLLMPNQIIGSASPESIPRVKLRDAPTVQADKEAMDTSSAISVEFITERKEDTPLTIDKTIPIMNAVDMAAYFNVDEVQSQPGDQTSDALMFLSTKEQESIAYANKQSSRIPGIYSTATLKATAIIQDVDGIITSRVKAVSYKPQVGKERTKALAAALKKYFQGIQVELLHSMIRPIPADEEADVIRAICRSADDANTTSHYFSHAQQIFSRWQSIQWCEQPKI
jgi:hypothetical protein